MHLLHLAKLRATEAFDVASIFTWDEATEASLDSAQLASVSGKAHGYPGIGHRSILHLLVKTCRMSFQVTFSDLFSTQLRYHRTSWDLRCDNNSP
ncbi:hypothetical protein U8335_09040 [Roseiconus lacunae]|uniref:hypothetical protein n=1 Tax=Roseiconus lacunae TaxID=2605694 RepID=UPI00309368BC|nr:hypothetical protein U8335_09040 [Stieleria sp. HD01]